MRLSLFLLTVFALLSSIRCLEPQVSDDPDSPLADPGLAQDLDAMAATKAETESLSCNMCHSILNSMSSVFLSDFFFIGLKWATENLCALRYSFYFCDMAENNLVKPLLRGFVRTLLNSDVNCVKHGFCKYPILIPDKNSDYARRVLSSKPPTIRPRVGPNPKKMRFVVFTDVHVDYHYKEGAEADCGYPVCCRDKPGPPSAKKVPKDPSLAGVMSGKWGTVASCDLPANTLYSFINYTVNEIKPDFFIWLGDNTGHNVWEPNKTEHLLGPRDLSHRMSEKYGKRGQMYPVMGNHEGIPCDEFDIHSDSHQWILNNLTDLWSNWLTPESQATFRKYGCYSQLHPGTSLRILGLFPLVADALNPFIWKNSTDPWNQLDWMENELAQSERNHESVFILNHFSTNTYFMNKDWGYRYRVLLDRYTNVVRGIFSGHTHEDSFQVMRSILGNEVTAIIHVNPALSTFPKVNPSFRVYEMDAETFTLLDYVQYRMYVKEANEKDMPIWRQAYRFTEFFQVPNLDYYNFPVIVDRMNKNSTFFKVFMDQFWSEGPRGPDMIASHPTAVHFMTCRFLSSDLYEHHECMHWDYLMAEYYLGYGILARYLIPEWAYAIYGPES